MTAPGQTPRATTKPRRENRTTAPKFATPFEVDPTNTMPRRDKGSVTPRTATRPRATPHPERAPRPRDDRVANPVHDRAPGYLLPRARRAPSRVATTGPPRPRSRHAGMPRAQADLRIARSASVARTTSITDAGSCITCSKVNSSTTKPRRCRSLRRRASFARSDGDE